MKEVMEREREAGVEGEVLCERRTSFLRVFMESTV